MEEVDEPELYCQESTPAEEVPLTADPAGSATTPPPGVATGLSGRSEPELCPTPSAPSEAE